LGFVGEGEISMEADVFATFLQGKTYGTVVADGVSFEYL